VNPPIEGGGCDVELVEILGAEFVHVVPNFEVTCVDSIALVKELSKHHEKLETWDDGKLQARGLRDSRSCA
jgi:hypothetical protein